MKLITYTNAKRNMDDIEKHKAIVNQLFSEVWTQAIFRNLGKLISPKFIFHIRGKAIEQQPKDLVEIVSRWKHAFPDIRFEIEGLVAENDMVAARVFYSGTHTKEWKGIPPTGKQVTVHEMMFFRFENERIIEVWEVPDEFSLRGQLTENAEDNGQ